MNNGTAKSNRAKRALERYYVRKNKNLCVGCGKTKPLKDKLKCESCFAKYNLQKIKRQENNICHTCNKNNRVDGYTQCVKCIEKGNERYKSIIQSGICSNCFKNPAIDGERNCLKCKGIKHEKRKLRDVAGICRDCKNKTIEGKKLCQHCISKRDEFSKIRRTNRLANNQCPDCGNSQLEGNKLCLKCYLKSTASQRLGDSKRWKELHGLFELQNGICPYTNLAMKLGLNTTLDHKIAICNNGSNDPENLQWVYRDDDVNINTMKGYASEEIFISFCKKIANHHESKNLAITPQGNKT